MSTETDGAPFSYGDLVTITFDAVEMPSPFIGAVRSYGTFPAPWVLLDEHKRGEVVVFLGPGVIVRLA